MKKEDLYRLYHKGLLNHLDIHFANFLTRLANRDSSDLFLAGALASTHTREGHICIDLSEVGGKPLIEGDDIEEPLVCPPADDWCRSLRDTPVVGIPGQFKPLIMDKKSRLYLYRYWNYQKKLSDFIRERLSRSDASIDIPLLKEGLNRLFPAPEDEGIDWQKVAALTALIKRFCVISGGPGTGKTTTVAKILVLLLEQAGPERLRIALTAPTGKAAARLQEAIKLAKADLNCLDPIKEAIPEESSTIHRLLGTIPGSTAFYYNARNRLQVDVVVVDEASMVDLALMSKLIQAMPSQARLILLGDKDQLASVEAGAVLGDICDRNHVHRFSRPFLNLIAEVTGYEIQEAIHGAPVDGIQDCIVQLQKSYRFGWDSGIDAVSRAVNSGDHDHALALLMEGKHADIQWSELPPPNALPRAIRETIIREYGDQVKCVDPAEIPQVFERFQVLCALREGPYGVRALNRIIEKILEQEGLIRPETRWYAGRPIIMTKNDYNLQLYNGDVGLTLPDPMESHELRVFFPSSDGSLRKFHPIRLPEHETVYAMTVHKSQGSEFERVMFLLPDRDVPVLTRELIYTGITRARKTVTLLGTQNVFRNAISRRMQRTSGLRDALWEQ